jgi:hypothetical protein
MRGAVRALHYHPKSPVRIDPWPAVFDTSLELLTARLDALREPSGAGDHRLNGRFYLPQGGGTHAD